jgi:hypothetical protein
VVTKKSFAVTAKFADCESPPLVPLIVIVYMPVVEALKLQLMVTEVPALRAADGEQVALAP